MNLAGLTVWSSNNFTRIEAAENGAARAPTILSGGGYQFEGWQPETRRSAD
jgi:hypothetical protein